MTRVIAIANQKGGSAKTTTTINLGAALAAAGHSTLLIDLDSQGHLAEGFGIAANGLEHELSEVLDNKRDLASIVLTLRPKLDLAPANIRLSYLEPYLITRARREDRLKHALKPLLEDYRFVLIDCPPSLGILTVNGFSAADEILIPMAAEFYALIGVSLLLETLQDMRIDLNPELALLGIVPTRMTHTRHAQAVVERAKEELAATVRFFEPPIPETVKIRDAAAAGVPIFEFDPASPAAAAYYRLAEEVGR
jgi:chromosome partitioning protein